MRGERRQNFRVEWKSPAAFYDGEGRRHPCVVSDLSNGGAKITGAKLEAMPDDFLLLVSPHSALRSCHVAWRGKGAVGVRFTDRPSDIGRPEVRSTRKTAAI